MRFTSTLILACACLTIPTLAWAAPERVELRDGSILQGELVEKVPGDHITIKLATGEIRRIEWAAIGEPAPPSPVSQSVPQTYVSGEAPAATIRVAVTSDRPGTVLRRVENLGTVTAATQYGTAYGMIHRESIVCKVPCIANVDPSSDAIYYAAGEGFPATERIRIKDTTSQLHVKAGNWTRLTIGAFASLIGGLSLITGAIVLPVGLATKGSAQFNADTNTWTPGTHDAGVIAAGITTLAAGVILLAVGIPLVVAGKTRVTDENGERLARNTTPKLTLSGLTF